MRPCGTYDVKYEQSIDFVRTKWQKFLLIALFISFLTIPTFFGSASTLVFLIAVGSTILVMTSMNIMMGYTGILSIAQIAFTAVGGYTVAILAKELHTPFLLNLFMGGLVTAIGGTLLALPALRLKGFALAGASLATHYLIMWTITHGGKLTGERHGLGLPWPSIGGWVLDKDAEYYAFTAALVILSLLLAKNIVRSRLGRAFVAIRDNDIAAEVMGINAFKYRTIAFFIGTFYAGLGGALWASYTMRVHPDNYLLFDTVWYLGFLIVGGAGSIMGAVFGTFAWKGLQFVVVGNVPLWAKLFPFIGTTLDIYANFAGILLGLVVLVFLILKPRGLQLEWSIFKTFYRLWPFSY